MRFAIYNFAGNGWWLPNMKGLTGNQGEAGLFDVEAAACILDTANRRGREDIAVPENRVYFTTGNALRTYVTLMDATLPMVRMGEFDG